MGSRTGIEWADSTWSPVTGCTRVSDGCVNCYIERSVPFRVAHREFTHPRDGAPSHAIGATTGVQLHPERLKVPASWRDGRRIFVCSLSDLFHDEVPDEFLVDVWQAMADAPQHTYLVLTKRPARARALLGPAGADGEGLLPTLPNVWLGVTVEHQTVTYRLDILADTSAALRWVSAEPLLGPLDLSGWLPGPCAQLPGTCMPTVAGVHVHGTGCPALRWRAIDWLIVGGESGPGAHPMATSWARDLRDQCAAAGVPFLFKQWGEWAPVTSGVHGAATVKIAGSHMARVGRVRAGRHLDGRIHDSYPNVEQ